MHLIMLHWINSSHHKTLVLSTTICTLYDDGTLRFASVYMYSRLYASSLIGIHVVHQVYTNMPALICCVHVATVRIDVSTFLCNP